MSNNINIEEFYKLNDIDNRFDEDFYQTIFPDTKDFYQPYCRENGISEKQRLYYHYINYNPHYTKEDYYFKDRKNKIYIKVENGLANRLRTLDSFYNFAIFHDRDLHVCWDKGPGWGEEHFLDLFDQVEKINFISLEEYDNFSKSHINLDKLVTKNPNNPESYIFGVANAQLIEIINKEDFCYCGDFALEFYLPSIKTNSVFFDKLFPTKRIAEKIKSITSIFNENTIGVHIRRGDAWTSPWRSFFERSNDEAFIKEMNKRIQDNPNTNFYLSTDCEETHKKFVNTFNNKVIWCEKEFVNSNDYMKPKYGQEAAVIDSFCLSKTSEIIGSEWSSFSQLASKLGKKPISIARSDTANKPNIKTQEVSVVCAVKNRTKSLLLSLQSWLMFPQIKNIVIVDWSSDVPVEEEIKVNSKIKIVRVEGQKYYNVSKALNLAFKNAPDGLILKLDADYILNPYFNFFEKYSISEKEFLTGCWRDTALDGDSGFLQFLHGLLFIDKEDFLLSGGYNEEFEGYGYEDCDLYKSLEDSGLKHKYLNHQVLSVFHIPHSDNYRSANYESKNIHHSLNQNLIISKKKVR